MFKISKISLILILLTIFILLSGFFAIKWVSERGKVTEKKWKGVEEEKDETKNYEGVRITTDKIEYKQGERINYIIKNNLNISIWFPIISPNMTWLDIEKKQEEMGWRELGYSRECIPSNYKPEAPPLVEVKAGERKKLSWNQFFCATSVMKSEYKLAKGIYRFRFTYYKKPDLILMEGIEIYSNEFKIE